MASELVFGPRGDIAGTHALLVQVTNSIRIKLATALAVPPYEDAAEVGY